MTGYLALLGSATVRRLVLGASIARLPTGMLPLAILLLVVETSGSIAAAGLIAGAFSLGRSIVSPAVGALIDRAGQTPVLVGGSVLQAVLLVALVAAAEARLALLAVGAIAAVAGAASPPVQASLRALWPQVTNTPAQRATAYSFDATSQELIWIAGPLIVAAMLGSGSAAAAVIASGVFGCAGVALYATTSAARHAPRAATTRSFAGALAAPGFVPLVGTSAFEGVAWGALSFGLSALAVQVGQRQSSGLLLAALSVGSVAGGLYYGSREWRADLADRFRNLLILSAVLAGPLLVAGSVVFAIPAAIVSGLPLAPLYASSYLLTGTIAPRDRITEAFTWTSSAFSLGVGLGTAASGVAVGSAGVRGAFGLACLAPLAACVLVPLVRGRRAIPETAEAR